jgi:hypothetical protein
MLASKVSVALTATSDIAVNLHVYNSDKVSSLTITLIYEAMFDNEEVMKKNKVQTGINCATVLDTLGYTSKRAFSSS